MRLTRFVRGQLIIFSILTVIGMVVMAGSYVHLPAMLGIGRYTVTVKLQATGGLYPTANVSYRGTDIGKVTDVKLTPDGVDAVLSLGTDHKVPKDVDAYVRSVSAIGEQYIDLVPNSNAGGTLRDGAVIPVEHTKLPQDVGDMLNQADRLLSSIADTKLRELIDEAFVAFNGAGPDLQKFIDSASLLVQEAKKNTDSTKDLLAQVGPLLDTQVTSQDDIRSWTRDLATVTDQLRQHDPSLGQLLQRTPSAAAKAQDFFQDLKPTLPLLLSNMVSVGQVGVTYHAGLEQILVVFPPLMAGLLQAASGPERYGAYVDFMLGLGDPPPCMTGFLPPDQWRSPKDQSIPDTPSVYCKVPQDAPEAVRGIRNTPCADVPGKRAPTPELCHDPNGYVPQGTNPPYGPPQPVSPAGQPVPGPGAQPASFTGHLDPGTGTFTGPDGNTYRQGDVAANGSGKVPSSWQAMFEEQQG
ncbi:MCE family protein [Nocardia stercoris]|uniref:MCE family protein n=1 Tax=Nocardia stercoris TaxID=2483361 RepID=A0A3M2KUZ0_9NOCA|nr:MlaD family protein [Nocardia stercoris]RMI28240.1 MCE family protein [Nocardia stercoris]